MLKYTLSAKERYKLQEVLKKNKISPYTCYPAFKEAINEIIIEGSVPEELHKFINDSKAYCQEDEPFVFIEGFAVDSILPYFDNYNPVEEKKELKRTYISEGILELYAQIRNEKPIGYLNVNNGDIFQDIFPKQDLFNSQSQKALNNIYFHKDLANHFVRPDWVNLLCLRNDIENMIVTCFVRNKDVLSCFSKDELNVLTKPIFYTPWSGYTFTDS